MVQTIVRVGSLILLFIIVINIWSQNREKEGAQSRNTKKK